MDDSILEETRKTASLYFKGVDEEKPYELWKSFDKKLAKDLSLFITGRMYSRGIIPHNVRQLITISALTVLGKSDELKLHIKAALNVGCTSHEIVEVIFQTFTYGGIPTVNSALKILRNVLREMDLWPIDS